VIGNAVPFNGDAYAPAVRDRLAGQLRASARRSGLRLWEPDATVISSQLLRDRPMEPARPRGAWLRAWADSGVRSEESPAMLSITGEPVDAKAYWPSSLLRHRGSVADLADAVVSSRGRLRWLGIGLLLRELYAFPLAFWLFTPWLLSVTAARPFSCPPWIMVALVVVPAALRWIAERHVHGVALHPLEDALATAYDAPGSALALSAALTRRVVPTRLPLPGQPLAWAALGFASITLVPLLSAGPQDRRLTTVGMALVQLGLLWLFAMRAVFQRDWSRAMYRVRVRLPVRVAGRGGTTREASPVGMAVEGPLGDIAVGSEVAVEIDLDDGSLLLADARIASRRLHRDGHVLGVTLDVAAPDRVRWTAQLSRAASATIHDAVSRRITTHRAPRASARRRVVAGGAVALVGVTALIAAVMLCLALAGYRPLVVRSGSMEPAFGVGDIVIVEDVAVGKLTVRDVVTFPDPSDDSDTLTHRVVETVRDGHVVTVVTQGDANTTAESFTATVDTVVARVVWQVPGNGSWIAWAGSRPVRWVVGLSALGVGAVVWRERRTARRARNRRGDSTPAPPGVRRQTETGAVSTSRTARRRRSGRCWPAVRAAGRHRDQTPRRTGS